MQQFTQFFQLSGPDKRCGIDLAYLNVRDTRTEGACAFNERFSLCGKRFIIPMQNRLHDVNFFNFFFKNLHFTQYL